MSDRFGHVRSRWAVAEGLRADLELWLPEYLAAYERQSGDDELVDGDGHATQATKEWQTLEVRHSGITFLEEDALPAIVVWIAGVTGHRREQSGELFGTVQIGVSITAGARDLKARGDLVHRYAAAITDLTLDHPTCGDLANRLDLTDEDFTRLGPDRGGIAMSADLSFEAHQVLLASRGRFPAGVEPRDDPRPPWTPDGVFESATLGTGVVSDATGSPPFVPVDPLDDE